MLFRSPCAFGNNSLGVPVPSRLVELDTLLNIDGKGQAHAEAVVAKSTRTSVLDSLKRPVTPRSTDKKPKQHEEVR